ncbi:MAG TPA: response regulator [Planctomycetaceae bacterium]|jgi:CheY-like chemotaxis protein|nr:response regulator [Planctomycetaceae bacterium]
MTKDAVLLVDDDRDVAFGASLRLRAAGYETLMAHDGHEGVDVARKRHPAAIVLDVRMPRMNGLVALANLQRDQRTKDIPIVMLSASLVDQQAALAGGARYFLTKPYQPTNLVMAVGRAIAENVHD